MKYTLYYSLTGLTADGAELAAVNARPARPGWGAGGLIKAAAATGQGGRHRNIIQHFQIKYQFTKVPLFPDCPFQWPQQVTI